MIVRATYPRLWLGIIAFMVCSISSSSRAQTCLTSEDLDATTRTAVQTAARRFFDMAAKGDTAALQQNSNASLAGDFSGVANAIKDHQSSFAEAQAELRLPYFLKAEGNAPIAHAEFLCGVFNKNGQTAKSAVFVIPNLPPGTYAVEIFDVSSKTPLTVTMVLQQMGQEWQLAGFEVRASQVAGHDGSWFADQARQYKAKGQLHNAWFYFLEARYLSAPVDYMATLTTDSLGDEAQAIRPEDLPSSDHPLQLESAAAGGKPAKSYSITSLFPEAYGSDFDLEARYTVPDVSNTGQTFQDNVAVMKALLAKYPELRDAFAGLVARAVTPSGQDYGTMLPMKDIH
jgi:hypothetical protein